MADDYVSLEPSLYGGLAYFYAKKNAAFSEILLGDKLLGITSEWTATVLASYIAKVSPRSDPSNATSMAGATRAEVFIGGYEGDRWIGQIVVGVEYAMADEFGRHAPAEGQNDSTYEGSGALRAALYENLPRI